MSYLEQIAWATDRILDRSEEPITKSVTTAEKSSVANGGSDGALYGDSSILEKYLPGEFAGTD